MEGCQVSLECSFWGSAAISLGGGFVSNPRYISMRLSQIHHLYQKIGRLVLTESKMESRETFGMCNEKEIVFPKAPARWLLVKEVAGKWYLSHFSPPCFPKDTYLRALIFKRDGRYYRGNERHNTVSKKQKYKCSKPYIRVSLKIFHLVARGDPSKGTRWCCWKFPVFQMPPIDQGSVLGTAFLKLY